MAPHDHAKTDAIVAELVRRRRVVKTLTFLSAALLLGTFASIFLWQIIPHWTTLALVAATVVVLYLLKRSGERWTDPFALESATRQRIAPIGIRQAERQAEEMIKRIEADLERVAADEGESGEREGER